MSDGRWWVALITFERGEREQEILPDSAQGACGWMIALAPDEDSARALLVSDLEHHALRVLEICDEQEVFDLGEIEDIDEHLAANFASIEPGKRTVWGTIHCYGGEGEA
ncbi:hypothetical protein [Sphingopyxis sp.]|uniref:hypothetical protein n=1 Tax=Sphingopyxis sp. TaxID=1908224 RepID=UPI002B468817|nr:hypothetical protein [Sphingopyxis sp.]HJS11120.1 hypothetical protein [Sphingopyxis sp.]